MGESQIKSLLAKKKLKWKRGMFICFKVKSRMMDLSKKMISPFLSLSSAIDFFVTYFRLSIFLVFILSLGG